MSEEVNEVVEENAEMETIKELMGKVDAMIEPEKYADLEQKYKKLLKDYTERRPAPKKKEIGYSERQVTKQDLFVLQRLPLSNDEILKLISEIPDRQE